jgi:streptogramin lyase
MTIRSSSGIALFTLTFALCACSGGASNPRPAALHATPTAGATSTPAASATPTSMPAATPTPAPSSAATAPSAGNDAYFVIVVSAPSSGLAASSRRHPLDVSASAQSVTIALGSTILATRSLAAASCTPLANGFGHTCTVGANAPAGSDTFTITVYDQPGGAGNVLASGTVTATVSPSAPVTVDVALDGTVVRFALTILDPNPPVGTATSTKVFVTGFDADGNVVLGNYPEPVTLADADTSGATSLSATTVTSSSAITTLRYSGAVPYESTTITATAPGFAPITATFAPTPAFLSFWGLPSLPPPFFFGAGPADIALGSDGNMWILGQSYSELMRVTPSGALTQYPLPSSSDDLMGLALGADGDLWFGENANSAIGKISPVTGTITEYPLPLGAGGFAQPNAVALGPDGKIWFLDFHTNVIGSITPSGTIAEYPLPGKPEPAGLSTGEEGGLTAGPDGNLWVSVLDSNEILKVSTSGTILASYTIPTPNAEVIYLTAGPDGNVWFAEFGAGKIGRVTPSGAFAEYGLPEGLAAGPLALTPGPDGLMWFTEMSEEAGIGKIGSIALDGSHVEDYLGNGVHVRSLAFAPTRKLWYVVQPMFGGGYGTFGY